VIEQNHSRKLAGRISARRNILKDHGHWFDIVVHSPTDLRPEREGWRGL